MQRVLRFGNDGDITHILACVIDGQGQYITKADHDRFMDIKYQDVLSYYSDEPESEYMSLIEDISELVSGELDIDTLRFRLLRNQGLTGEVVKINGLTLNLVECVDTK